MKKFDYNKTVANTARKFICFGCAKLVVRIGEDKKTHAFIWHDPKTSEPHYYCYECDDLLIQGVATPNKR